MALRDGKMVIMNAITEIDKAGRIVVPKKMRDALRLVAGTRLTLKQEGERITLEPECKPGTLILKGSVLVRCVEGAPPLAAVDWVKEDRELRMQAVVGDRIGL